MADVQDTLRRTITREPVDPITPELGVVPALLRAIVETRRAGQAYNRAQTEERKAVEEPIPESMLAGGPVSTGAMAGIMRGATRGANPLIDLSRRVMPVLTRAVDRLPDIGVLRNARDLPAGVLGRFERPVGLGMAMRQQYPGGLLQLGPVSPGTPGVHQTIAELLESLGHEGGHALFYHRNVAPRGAMGKWTAGTALPNLTRAQARDALLDAVRRGDLPGDLVQQYFARDPKFGLQHALVERLGQRHLARGWPQGLSREATERELLEALNVQGRAAPSVPPLPRRPRLPTQRELPFEVAAP
jgi:hypothetical protein